MAKEVQMKEVLISRADLLHIKEMVESVEVELDQLIYDKEWYVTDVLDLVESSKEILNSKLKETK